MLKTFRQHGESKTSNYHYQFWQHENHLIVLDSAEILEQRINYLHENPVRAGFVEAAEHWKYSSAIDYYAKGKIGMLEIVSVH